MREVATELKELRLYGMSSAWEDLVAQGNTVGLQTASWLVEHLLDMEHTGVAPLDWTHYCSVKGVRNESKKRGVCA